jgi:hypothetical protein
LERSLAIAVVRDILESDCYFINSFELIKSGKQAQYNLKIKGSTNKLSKEVVAQIAKTYNLRLKEDEGFLIY